MTAKPRTCEYCGDDFRGTKGLRIHQARAHDGKASTTIQCTWCGADIEIREWEADGRHYCSTDCSQAWNRYLKRGERHPNYKDGRSAGRGRDYELIMMAVRARDDRCLRCDADHCHGDSRRLHVHHIIPEDEHDSPHTPTNLMALCDACHRVMEGMPRENQLAECGLNSVEDLQLTEDLREWLKTARERVGINSGAPEPCLAMFAEAQKVLDKREKAEE